MEPVTALSIVSNFTGRIRVVYLVIVIKVRVVKDHRDCRRLYYLSMLTQTKKTCSVVNKKRRSHTYAIIDIPAVA